MKKYLRTRVGRLDAKGFANATAVTIEMDLCATPAHYELAFNRAWKKVPAGSVVYCWMRPLSDHEYIAMAEGRLVNPHVMGIYLKPRASNHLSAPGHTEPNDKHL